jgi:hypothetical protein
MADTGIQTGKLWCSGTSLRGWEMASLCSQDTPETSKHGGKLVFAFHPSQLTQAEKCFSPFEIHLI